jgi:hypothetical protein
VVASGCGGGDDNSSSSTTSTTSTTTEEASTLPPEEQVAAVANEWAGLFSSGDREACDLMIGEAVYACENIYLKGAPTPFVLGFSGAVIEAEDVQVKGGEATAIFSTSDGIELRGDPETGEWFVTNIGGNAGQNGP